MPSGRCDQCGVEEYMPYVCKFCKGRFCAAHRLPENHTCSGLSAHRDRVRAEGRVFAPEAGRPMTPRVAATARAGASMDALWSALDGKMSYVFIGVAVATYILQWIVASTAGGGLHNALFVLSPGFWFRPWTLVTSVFAHSLSDLNHLLFNALAILFFGQTVERLLGTRRYTYLFVGAGMAAGVVQVILTNYVLSCGSISGVCGVLGASGGIMGITAALVVLAPTMTVLIFFVVPAPLWALGIFYVLMDLVGVISPGDPVARFAHLAGFAIGAAYGWYLRNQGLRAVTRQPPPMRRAF